MKPHQRVRPLLVVYLADSLSARQVVQTVQLTPVGRESSQQPTCELSELEAQKAVVSQ